MSGETPVPSLPVALSRVMRDLPGIGKDDSSKEGQGVPYKYRGIETITAHLAPILASHGVVLIPNARVISITPSPGMKVPQGSAITNWTDTLLEVEWTIVGPAGDTLTARTCGMGRDNADKGVNKAMTQAFKYLLLDVFCIGDKADDADGNSYAEHVGGRDEPPAPPVVPPAAEVRQTLRDRAAKLDRGALVAAMRERNIPGLSSDLLSVEHVPVWTAILDDLEWQAQATPAPAGEPEGSGSVEEVLDNLTSLRPRPGAPETRARRG